MARYLWRGAKGTNPIPPQNCLANWNVPIYVGMFDIWAVKVVFPNSANGTIKIQATISDVDAGLIAPGGGPGTFSGSALAGAATLNGTLEFQIGNIPTYQDLGGSYTVTITGGEPPGGTTFTQIFNGFGYGYNFINIAWQTSGSTGNALINVGLKGNGGIA
jgi:hypothetical protein